MQIFLAKLICANRDHELVFIVEHGNIKSGSCFLFRHPSPIIVKIVRTKKQSKNLKWLIEILEKVSYFVDISLSQNLTKINFDQVDSIATLHLANMILLGLKLQV